jgi:hypothetical protein
VLKSAKWRRTHHSRLKPDMNCAHFPCR